MNIFGMSDVGKMRKSNQDRFDYVEFKGGGCVAFVFPGPMKKAPSPLKERAFEALICYMSRLFSIRSCWASTASEPSTMIS